jgi:hypothetical protein
MSQPNGRNREPADLPPIQVEILYFAGCPNHDGLAHRVGQLLTDHHLPARVLEVRVDTDNDAQRLAFLGSPTIRINGIDVDPATATRHGYGLQCRLYRTATGLHGTPPDDWILDAAHRAGSVL